MIVAILPNSIRNLQAGKFEQICITALQKAEDGTHSPQPTKKVVYPRGGKKGALGSMAGKEAIVFLVDCHSEYFVHHGLLF